MPYPPPLPSLQPSPSLFRSVIVISLLKPHRGAVMHLAGTWAFPWPCVPGVTMTHFGAWRSCSRLRFHNVLSCVRGPPSPSPRCRPPLPPSPLSFSFIYPLPRHHSPLFSCLRPLFPSTSITLTSLTLPSSSTASYSLSPPLTSHTPSLTPSLHSYLPLRACQ